MSSNVILVNPPSNLRMKETFGEKTSFITILKSAYIDDTVNSFPGENLGLEYLAAILRLNKISVEIVDACLEELDEVQVIDRINYFKPKLVAFTCTDQTIEEVEILSILLRESGFTGHITVGGLFATRASKLILEKLAAVDSVSLGEGENIILNLISAIIYNKPISRIQSISFRIDNRIILGKNNIINDLNRLPFPSRDQVPMTLKKNFAVAVSSSRGCPYGNCGFCYTNSSWRSRSAESLVGELINLIKKFHIEWVTFVDEDFIGPGNEGIKRVNEFIELIRKSSIELKFMIDTRVNNINKELMVKLKQIGLNRIFLGVESGSNKILRLYNKGQNVQQIEKALDILNDLDIKVVPGFIFFDPFSEITDLIESFKLFKKIGHYDLFRLTHKLFLDPEMQLYRELSQRNKIGNSIWQINYKFSSTKVEDIYNVLWEYVVQSFKIYLDIHKNKLELTPNQLFLIKENHFNLMENLLRTNENLNFQNLANHYYKHLEEIIANN